MARYTTTVKTICESLIDPQQYSDYLTIDNIVDNAVPKIFDYTIGLKFPEADIEKQILIEYFNREIAFETVGYWKMKMRSLLIKNREKYNNIYALFAKDNVSMFDDVDTIEKIMAKGVKFDVRKVPNDSPDNINAILNKAKDHLLKLNLKFIRNNEKYFN